MIAVAGRKSHLLFTRRPTDICEKVFNWSLRIVKQHFEAGICSQGICSVSSIAGVNIFVKDPDVGIQDGASHAGPNDSESGTFEKLKLATRRANSRLIPLSLVIDCFAVIQMKFSDENDYSINDQKSQLEYSQPIFF